MVAAVKLQSTGLWLANNVLPANHVMCRAFPSSQNMRCSLLAAGYIFRSNPVRHSTKSPLPNVQQVCVIIKPGTGAADCTPECQ